MSASASSPVDGGNQYYCEKCKQTFSEILDNGEKETYAQHRASTHLSCTCRRKYTTKRRTEHLDTFHPYVCNVCPTARFTLRSHLQRHVTAMHAMCVKCILCGLDDDCRPRTVCTSKQTLRDHVAQHHPGERVFICTKPVCSEVVKSHQDLMDHILLQHDNRCIYCEPVGSRGYPQFRSLTRLRQHIAVSHSQNPCFFCGKLFPTIESLYEHQKEHCPTTYKCGVCDTQFATMSARNNHQAQHISALGTCSTSSHPSQVQHNHTWHELNYRLRPWDRDAEKLVGMGMLQNKINALYNAKKARQQRQSSHVASVDNDDDIRNQSKQLVLEQYKKRIKDVYSENLHEFVTRTRKGLDGTIEKITCNLLENKPFLSQVDLHLMNIFDAAREQVPYKLGLSFGFLLYNKETDELRHFYIDEHLKRNPTNRNIIQQFPNIWKIKNDADEQQVSKDIRETDFFSQIKDEFAQNYNYTIVRATTMTASIFPIVDSAMYNDALFGNPMGRGLDDDDDDDDDDVDDGGDESETEEEEEEEDDEEEDDEERCHNPFIYREAEVDGVDDGDSVLDGVDIDEDSLMDGFLLLPPSTSSPAEMKKHREKLIEKYVKRMCVQGGNRGRKNSVFISLKRESRSGELCFFMQLAYWHMLCDGRIDAGIVEDGTSQKIKDLGRKYFNKYKQEYNISDESMFNGVSVKLIPFLESTFNTRINVYEIVDLEYKKEDHKIGRKSSTEPDALLNKCTPVLNMLHSCDTSTELYKVKCKTMNLLLYKDHYYCISDMSRLMVSNYICYGCGKKFVKQTRTNAFKRHVRNHCNKIRRSYKEGMVRGYANMWARAKYVFSIPDELLSDDDRDKYYTIECATYDFESLIKNISVTTLTSTTYDKLRDDGDGGGDDDSDVIEQERDVIYESDVGTCDSTVSDTAATANTVALNYPLSYAIACNFATRSVDTEHIAREIDSLPFSTDDGTVKLYEVDRSGDGKWSVVYGSNRYGRDLISTFVSSLKVLSKIRRSSVIDRYADIIDHIEAWFATKGIDISLRTTDGISSFSDIATAKEDYTDDDGVQRSFDYALNMYNAELALAKRLKIFLNVLPVLGFNSGGYDIPLIKSYLFDILINDCDVPTTDINFIKKQSRYVSMTISSLSSPSSPYSIDYGGLQFLDLMQYLAPGFSLSDFIRSFGDGDDEQQKSYFPYEYMDSYDKLGSVTDLPPYTAFYSRLKDTNVLNAEYSAYCIKNNMDERDGLYRVSSDKRPQTGYEKYDTMKDLWVKNRWENLGDYLEYYNVQDVIPFLNAICRYAREMRDNNVDLTRDAISLPGLAKKILYKHIRPKSLYHIDDPFVYSTIQSSEVGGQSIIFTRKNSEDHPYIKGFDANSLYLYCLGEGHYTGRPIVYRHIEGAGNYFRRRGGRRGGGKMYKDSEIAEEFIDYFEHKIVFPENEIVEWQYCIVFSQSEKKYMKDEYAKVNISQKLVKSSMVVDGMFIQPTSRSTGDTFDRNILEFNGCYWHACDTCTALSNRYVRAQSGVTLSAQNIRDMDRIRYEILSARGYTVRVMKECTWRRKRVSDPDVIQFCKSRVKTDPLQYSPEEPYFSTQMHIVNALMSGHVHGFITCTMRVPDDKREYFKDFAPFIKHANINMKDIGPFMQAVAVVSNIQVKNRRSVIDSYFGTRITLIDEYFVWLMNHGVELVQIHAFIRYEKEAIFKRFTNSITELRIEGDKDKSCELKALIAKNIGNSAVGNTITNKDKFRKVKVVKLDNETKVCGNSRFRSTHELREIASMNTFIKYEKICPNVLEVESKHSKIVYDQIRMVGATIFGRAKVSVLKFYYDFIKEIMSPDNYVLMETDTDSIYLALKHERFEDNIAPDKFDRYEEIKHEYFITEQAKYGKRQPNRYKVECEGHFMLALCSKSYCVYNENTNAVKYSLKGVQKKQLFTHTAEDDDEDEEYNPSKNVYKLYKSALKTSSQSNAKSEIATNRGLKRRYQHVVMYEQEKTMFSSFYCKRRVLHDGIRTVPLDI